MARKIVRDDAGRLRNALSWIGDGFTLRDVLAAIVSYTPIAALVTAVVSYLGHAPAGAIAVYSLLAALLTVFLVVIVNLAIDYFHERKPRLAGNFGQTRFVSDPSGGHAVILDFCITNTGAPARVTNFSVELLPHGSQVPIAATPHHIASALDLPGNDRIEPGDLFDDSVEVPAVGTPWKRMIARNASHLSLRGQAIAC